MDEPAHLENVSLDLEGSHNPEQPTDSDITGVIPVESLDEGPEASTESELPSSHEALQAVETIPISQETNAVESRLSFDSDSPENALVSEPVLPSSHEITEEVMDPESPAENKVSASDQDSKEDVAEEVAPSSHEISPEVSDLLIDNSGHMSDQDTPKESTENVECLESAVASSHGIPVEEIVPDLPVEESSFVDGQDHLNDSIGDAEADVPSSHDVVPELAVPDLPVEESSATGDADPSNDSAEVEVRPETIPSSHDVIPDLPVEESSVASETDLTGVEVEVSPDTDVPSSHEVVPEVALPEIIVPDLPSDDSGAVSDLVPSEVPSEAPSEVLSEESLTAEIPTSHDIAPAEESLTAEVPTSHDIAPAEESLTAEVPTSHEVTPADEQVPERPPLSRTPSTPKENPFNDLLEAETQKEENIAATTTATAEASETPEEVDSEKAAAAVAPAKPSPMVVSVGTIKFNGNNHYEDINIMSKGDAGAAATAPPVPEQPTEDNKEFESLRDIRFSSISMYDKPHFEEDIVVVVDDAQKHAAESFVSYRVITKTTRESFQQEEFHVRRRYNDFHWLCGILTQQYPSHIIPPLPQKKVFNKYDPDFVRLRQLALNKFLCRIAEHPILSTSEHFFIFLSARQLELEEAKKAAGVKKFTMPQIPVANLENPFRETSEYLESFGKILNSLSTESTKLHKEQNELSNSLMTLPPSLMLWTNSEESLEPVLNKFGEGVGRVSEAMEGLIALKEEMFTESIKEYQRYVTTVKSVLRNRDHMQVAKDFFTTTVLSKQRDLERLEASEPGKSFATFFGKSPAQVKSEKISRLQQEITSLSNEGEQAGDALVVASAAIRSDIERWNINKEKDCRALFSSLSAAHTDYYTNSINVWQELMDFIDKE